MAKIARQRRRVETQPDTIDMGGMHDIALYNVNLFTGTSFQQRAYDSPAKMASRVFFFFFTFVLKPRKTSRAPLTVHTHVGAAPTRTAKTSCSSTHNAHFVCANHLPRPGSRQLARPCRSKMRGGSACPRNIFQKGYENLVIVFRTGKKACTWVHVVVSKRRKVEASNSEQKVCCVLVSVRVCDLGCSV